MCEPLRGKINYELLIYSDYDNFGDRDTVIKQWQDFAKNVKSAVEFYKKYRNAPNKLKIIEQEIWEKFYNSAHLGVDWVDYYNDWLFDYCFGDVIE